MTRAARQRSVTTDEGRKHRPDYLLIVISVSLLLIGLIVVFAISPGLSVQRGVDANYFVTKQLIAIVLGIITFFITSRVSRSSWRKLQRPLVLAALIATVVAVIMPVTPEYPAHRWIRFGGLSLQAVEVIKFAILIWLSYFFADRMC